MPPSARAELDREEQAAGEEDTAVTSALPPTYQQGVQQRPVIAPPDYIDALQDQIISQPVESPSFNQVSECTSLLKAQYKVNNRASIGDDHYQTSLIFQTIPPEFPATTPESGPQTTPPPYLETEEPPPPVQEAAEEVELVVPTDEPDMEDSGENDDDTTPLNP